MQNTYNPATNITNMNTNSKTRRARRMARKTNPQPESRTNDDRLRMEGIAIMRHSRIYVDTCALLNGNCHGKLQKLARELKDFGKTLLVPACVVGELEKLKQRGGRVAKLAARVLRRIVRKTREGLLAICNPETAGQYADKAIMRILANMPAGEKAVLITEDRPLAAALSAANRAANGAVLGRFAACRLNDAGYPVPLQGPGASCAGELQLLRPAFPANLTFCPYAYKRSDWDGVLEEDLLEEWV